MKDDSGTPTRLDAWRRESGGAKVMEYGTASGGWVIQLPAYVRLYVHCCDDCGDLIIVSRDIRQNKQGSTWTGRWPSFCASCSMEKTRKHDQGAAERMRRLRADRRVQRDEAFRRAGVAKPKPRGRHAKA